ncbi:MAG: peptidase M49 [Acidobacteria bacterium]|nr:peptidase M49 [Acidobacteriota bacterium]HCD02326.1 peptidase M49 [Planctomycetaceae bacterium]
MRHRGAVMLAAVVGAALSGGAPAPAAAQESGDRPYLLERVDDAAIVQLYADGFASLSLREKTLIWHLYQAALAGRDIYYDQRYEHNLEMREVLEEIITHPAGVDPTTLDAIHQYTKLFWLNTGPFNNLTARKFVLNTTPTAFAAAVAAAAEAGATLPTHTGETVTQMVARMQSLFFDLDVDPIVTNKAPGPGDDLLLSSANNLYKDVSTADLDGFEEQYPLTSRLVKVDGRLVEEVYKVGGKYSEQITEIIRHLEAAAPFATEPMAKALRANAVYYRTGAPVDQRAYDIAWVADQESSVDTINGFTEVYMDARGAKGAWEALVFYVNPEKTGAIKTLAANAQWFENRMPWDPKYRKDSVTGITANAIDVVVETGDSGPITPIGINLPNNQAVREQYGSKSVSLSNVNDAYDQSSPANYRQEFAWSPEEAERSRRWGRLAGEMTTNMHEVIGHASGKLAERLGGSAQPDLKEQYSALEEARADLVGLYFLPDPKLVELGVLPADAQEEIVRAEYESYTRNALLQLRRIREGTQIEQDHMRNRQMIVRWLMDNTTAIEPRTRDGKTFFVMTDWRAFREGVATLLAEVQRIKSEGDYEAARTLFESYGIYFDGALRDEVVERVASVGLPSYTGFVQPRLEPVVDADGVITDVRISYPQDFTAQMLEYSGKSMP